MKLLVLNWRDIRSPEAGGSEVHLHEILSRVVQRGHDVDLVASHFASRPSRERDEADGVQIHRVGDWRLANYAIPWRARAFLRRGAYDLVVDCLTKLPFFAPAFSRGVPVIGIVYHLFGGTVFRETDPLSGLYCTAFETLIPPVYARTPLVAISKSTRDDLVQRGLDADRIEVVHCGLDHDLYQPARRERRSRTPLLAVVSRLKRYKCVDHAIRALSRVREILTETRLVIAGTGDDRPRLERLMAKLGLSSHVSFLGHVSETEKVRLLQEAHLFLNTSHKEGWGLTSIEANACGTPVIAADRPGLRDSVRPETGRLVPWGKIDALGGAVLELLQDRELWTRLSSQAVRWADSFHWDRTAAETLILMEQAAERSAAFALPPMERALFDLEPVVPELVAHG
jgi:glycosyltransferase involved in cell wall biosynthesis